MKDKKEVKKFVAEDDQATEALDSSSLSSGQRDDEVITIDIQPFLMPLSIVVAGLFIGLGMFFGLKSDDDGQAANLSPNSQQNSRDVTGTTQTPIETPAETGNQPVTDIVTTSIDDDPILGNRQTAKIAIVEFSDYQCGYCGLHFKNNFEALKQKYVDTGQAIIVYRDYIAVDSHNPVATDQAVAAECVQEYAGDEAYYKFHDLVFNNNPQTQTQLSSYAASLGVGKEEFSQCFNDPTFKNEVRADQAAAITAGLRGTPGFVVGKLYEDGTVEGYKVSGYSPDPAYFDQYITPLL